MNNDQYLKNRNKETSQYIDKIKKLLDSKQEENLRLALQLVESGGVPPELLTYLYVIGICYEDLDIAKKAHELFSNNAPPELLDYTQNLWEYDDPLSLSEYEISEFLEESKKTQHFNSPLLANLMLKFGNVGGSYCLKNNTAPAEVILREIYNTEWLSLSSFELDKLPPEVGLFTETKHLVISSNNFSEIPDEIQNLINLERIYFDETPLSDQAIHRLDTFFPKAMGYHYSTLGRNAFHEKKYDDASYYMKKAITLDTSKADYWNVQGVTLGRLRNREEAIRCFEEALAINPQDTLAFSNKAHIYHLMGKETESLEAANAGLATYTQHPHISRSWEGTLYFRKGQALFYLNRFEESHEAYDHALSIEPSMGGAWFNKACTYARQCDKPEMLKHLKEAIRCDAKFRRDAPKDKDFEAYWQDKDFIALLDQK